MDESSSKPTKKPRNRNKAICRKTGDHVHYPPKRPPTHAPSPKNLKSSFRFPNQPKYGKCRKNQAASIGTTAYDGCGEFVSSLTGEDCAACGCNRSFHREEDEVKEEEESVLERCVRTGTVDDSVLEMLKITSVRFKEVFCSPYGDRRMEVDEEEEREKRLRMKFTVEQTEKMRVYAEKLMWKMSSDNGVEVDVFCGEIGVTRKNFRVWMNNHKEKS